MRVGQRVLADQVQACAPSLLKSIGGSAAETLDKGVFPIRKLAEAYVSSKKKDQRCCEEELSALVKFVCEPIEQPDHAIDGQVPRARRLANPGEELLPKEEGTRHTDLRRSHRPNRVLHRRRRRVAHEGRPEAPEGHFLELLVVRCAAYEFDERLTFSAVVSSVAAPASAGSTSLVAALANASSFPVRTAAGSDECCGDRSIDQLRQLG